MIWERRGQREREEERETERERDIREWRKDISKRHVVDVRMTGRKIQKVKMKLF